MLEFGTPIATVSYVERPGAYGIIRDDSAAIAVVKTTRGYFLPGGGVDEGEEFEAALRREILEEIGYESVVAAKIGIAAQYLAAASEKGHYKKIGHFYLTTLGAKTSYITEQDHELVWLSLPESCRLLNHQFQVWAVQEASKI